MKRLSAFLILFAMLLSVICIPVSALSDDLADFDTQAVSEDLKGMTFGGKKFSENDYPFQFGAKDYRGTTKLEIMAVVEYGYSTDTVDSDKSDDYGLYVYVYNPGNVALPINDKRAAISIAYGDSAYTYKHSLKYLGAAGDSIGHNRLYLKYKVNVSAAALRELVGSDGARVYHISEIEIPLSATAANATAYAVGGTYRFSGTMAGYGSDTSTIRADFTDRYVIELDVHSVVYRQSDGTQASEDAGILQQLNSVYFSIPDEVLLKYGNLSGASFEYYKYNTGSMVGFFDSKYYEAFKPYEGKTISSSDPPPNALFSSRKEGFLNGEFALYSEWKYGENWTSAPAVFDDTCLNYVFQYDKSVEAGSVFDTGVAEHFSKLWAKYNNGEEQYFFAGDKSAHYVRRDLDNREEEDWYQIDSFNTSWYQHLLPAGWYAPSSSGTTAELAPIVSVSSEALKDMGALYVDEFYKEELTAAVAAAEACQETVHLLRFDSSEYFAEDLFIDTFLFATEGGMVAREEIYMDFDILSLTFVRDGEETIVPTVSSPINIIQDIQLPFPAFENTESMSWWQMILLVIVAVFVLLILICFMPVLIDFCVLVVKILLLPFKLLAWLVGKISDMVTRK